MEVERYKKTFCELFIYANYKLNLLVSYVCGQGNC